MFQQPGAGSFPDPFKLYFSGLENMSQGMGPMRIMARSQLEMMGLMSRRAQAYMEIPSRLSRCRSPQDLVNEQMRFWQTAFQQYQESSQKVMQAWSQMAAAPMQTAPFASQPRRERDYISFPNTKGTNGATPPRGAPDRHVA